MLAINIIISILPYFITLIAIAQKFLFPFNCVKNNENIEENLTSISHQENLPLLSQKKGSKKSPHQGFYDFVSYGFDGAWVYHRLSILFIIYLGVGFGTFYGLKNTEHHKLGKRFLDSALFAAANTLEIMFFMAISTIFLKYFVRMHLVSILKLKGDEKVLDIACGRGFIMSGIARKLNNGGKITGVDIFDANIQSGNGMEVTLGNMNQLGYEERVEIHYGFAQDLKQFKDNSFDCITINFMIPYLDSINRKQAFREWNRVLKPGGIIVSSDMPWAAADIRGQLEELGFQDITTHFPHLYHFLPPIINSGRKSSSSITQKRTWRSYMIYLVFIASLIPWGGVFFGLSCIPLAKITDILSSV